MKRKQEFLYIIGFYPICGFEKLIMLRSRVIATLNATVAFSEQCVAKIVHGVLLLYLVVMPRGVATRGIR